MGFICDEWSDQVGVTSPMTSDDLVSRLLPILGRTCVAEFNVFDVMHHGTHEKQLSNIYRWLLEIGGTHGLEDLGQRLFVEQINKSRDPSLAVPLGRYAVRQEVNTVDADADADGDGDIADLVLEGDSAVIVVENYRTSDGHGHGYDRYLRFGQRESKTATVVLLCADEDRSLLSGGWEHAAVVTYEAFLDRLLHEVDAEAEYAEHHREQHAFIRQLHRKFASGRERVNNKAALDFVTAMCETGEAGRYKERSRAVAAERLASDIAQQARERFQVGAEVLQLVKAQIRRHSHAVVRQQVNDTMGYELLESATARYSGIYQWTVNLEFSEEHNDLKDSRLQIKFGPSAWYANEQDDYWERRVAPGAVDYSRLFLTREATREIRQSVVTMHDVLEGLSPIDIRLRDEIVDLLRGPTK